MSKRLDQYVGHLSPAEAAEGMNAALRNARRLVEDASTMLSSGRYPSAAALAALSIEESGKVSILRGLALARSQEEAAAGWREYRSHLHKNRAWILPQLVLAGARTLEDMHPIFDEAADHPQLLDQVKQLSFYTDCLARRHWSEPEQVIDKSVARSLVETAKVLASKELVTSEELELWVKHLKPVWKRGMAWMQTAYMNWHREMVERGLTTDSIGKVEDFVRGQQQEEPKAPHLQKD